MGSSKFWILWLLLIVLIVLIFPKECGPIEGSDAMDYHCVGANLPFGNYYWCAGMCFGEELEKTEDLVNSGEDNSVPFISGFVDGFKSAIPSLLILGVIVAVVFVIVFIQKKMKEANVFVPGR